MTKFFKDLTKQELPTSFPLFVLSQRRKHLKNAVLGPDESNKTVGMRILNNLKAQMESDKFI